MLGKIGKLFVDFFANLHCYEHVLEDISSGIVYVLEDNGTIVGTGSYKDNHITRVYVLPVYQGNGYGKYIVEKLEMWEWCRFSLWCND